MQTIANTPHYMLVFDASKNRLYWTPRGFWDKTVKADDLVNSWKKALQSVSSGFTILADATQIKTLLPEWTEMFRQIQEMAKRSGLAASAEVLPSDTITQMQASRVSRSSGMQRQVFDSKEEAEKWLDSL